MTFLHSYRDVSIVPILVGSLSPEREAHYGRILSKYLSDPSNFFVVSSDFCHWGQRFRYTYYDKSCGEIHQSIQRLDQQVRKLFVNDTKLRNFLLSFGSSFFGCSPDSFFSSCSLFCRACQLLKRLTPRVSPNT